MPQNPVKIKPTVIDTSTLGGRAEDGASVFNKLDRVSRVLAPLRQGDVDPLTVNLDEIISPTVGVILGQKTLLFGTNNYLGLNFDPSCRAAATEALQREGTGTTGSRVASGTYAGHIALEKEIAELFGRRAAVVFSTGFQANLGVISALAGPDDVILIDRDCHASIYDGCTLSRAKIVRFRHNSPADLERMIKEVGVPGGRILIIVEGLYSVTGTIAPLADFVDIKKRYGASLLVDEAHSFGVMGKNGLGVAEDQGVSDDIDVLVGTFSKAVGVIGGFCVSDHPQFHDLRFLARSYLYSASLPPPVVAAARASIKRIAEADDLRERLWGNARRFHKALSEMGYELLADPAPVIGVVTPGMAEGYRMWRTMLERGLYLNFLVPPSTPNGTFVLRCSLSAEHTEEQIDRAIEVFGECWDTIVQGSVSAKPVLSAST